MPEARFDPLGLRTVLVAPERAGRGSPPVPPDAGDPAPCDFCEGREDRTPPETFALREPGTAPDTPGWRVRTVPNLYPATPFHEVIVHAPDHDAVFERLARDHRHDVLGAWARSAASAPSRCVLPAFNRGRAAGASRSHEHGQVFGLDEIPPVLERETAAFAAGACVACDLAASAALVAEHGTVRAVAHPAPLVAHEILLIGACAPRFSDDDALGDTADALAGVLDALRASLGDGLATNVVVHTAPSATGRFHRHVHVYPRLAVWGALELGAEVPVVAADPDATAAMLRGATSR